jgi:hypothetical protein
MAREPADEGAIQVELSPDLEDWLRTRATDLDVEPEDVLVQLLSSYRVSETMGDGNGGFEDVSIEVSGTENLEEAVEPAVRAAVATAVDGTVDEEVEGTLATTLEERLQTMVTKAVDAELEAHEIWKPAESQATSDELEAELDARLENARADFHEKLEDVRERVIQVKREVDAKAAADHEHAAFERLEAVEERLETLDSKVTELSSELEATREEFEAVGEDAEAVDQQLADFEERLTTIAWVVSDLREAHESETGEAALQQLKREAAEADISRAKCENCSEGVEIGLLTEPACPHCDATVTTVEPSQGFFRSPRLLVAAQLESGEER